MDKINIEYPGSIPIYLTAFIPVYFIWIILLLFKGFDYFFTLLLFGPILIIGFFFSFYYLLRHYITEIKTEEDVLIITSYVWRKKREFRIKKQDLFVRYFDFRGGHLYFYNKKKVIIKQIEKPFYMSSAWNKELMEQVYEKIKEWQKIVR